MNLGKVHQILIGGGRAMGLGLALRSIFLFFSGQGGDLVLHGVLSLAVAGALGLYLRRFREKLRAASTPEVPEP
ncbi:MAG: hypothetical protein RIF41_01300 [Polyangiaceae bacterium]